MPCGHPTRMLPITGTSHKGHNVLWQRVVKVATLCRSTLWPLRLAIKACSYKTGISANCDWYLMCVQDGWLGSSYLVKTKAISWFNIETLLELPQGWSLQYKGGEVKVTLECGTLYSRVSDVKTHCLFEYFFISIHVSWYNRHARYWYILIMKNVATFNAL